MRYANKEPICFQAEDLIENVGYPDYIVDVDYMTQQYKEVCSIVHYIHISLNSKFHFVCQTIEYVRPKVTGKQQIFCDKQNWGFPSSSYAQSLRVTQMGS